MSVHQEIKKVTTSTFQKMKREGEKIAMVTCYDYSTAKLIDAAGIDSVLVGDSAANVMAGYQTTLPISLDQMIYYAASVVRGINHALTVVDMPFGTYQGDKYSAVKNAVRIMQETGAQAVKIEGGAEIEDSYKAILSAGIPIMGHLGLTPQSINKFGGYGLRAGQDDEAQMLIENAKLLQSLGCFSIVLEKIPAALAKKVTQSISIPTIGIGAGPDTDGQVLVFHDMIGINEGFKPKFLRTYANLADIIRKGVADYVNDVKTKSFPNEEESY